MKNTLLAGAAAFVLALGLSAGAWAHDVSVASRGGGDIIDDVIDHSFTSSNVVSTNVLAQVVVAQADSEPVIDAHHGYEGEIELKDGDIVSVPQLNVAAAQIGEPDPLPLPIAHLSIDGQRLLEIFYCLGQVTLSLVCHAQVI